MNLFEDIEKRLEDLFERFFSRQFKSHVQPVELAKRLAREMDYHRTVSVSQVYAPNRFEVCLSPQDFEAVVGLKETLVAELQAYLATHAHQQGYRLAGPITVTLAADESLGLGDIEVASDLAETREAPVHSGETSIISAEEADALRRHGGGFALIFPDTGHTFPLIREVVMIGRFEGNDLVLADAGASRQHARLRRRGSTYYLVDLGSTNGTLVNGTVIKRRELRDGDIITIGTTKLTFQARP